MTPREARTVAKENLDRSEPTRRGEIEDAVGIEVSRSPRRSESFGAQIDTRPKDPSPRPR